MLAALLSLNKEKAGIHHKNRPDGLVVKDIALGTRGSGFDSWAGQIRHSVATVAVFLGSCVAYGDESRHSLHASA